MTFDEYGAMIAREYFVYRVAPVPVIHGIRVTTYAEINGNKVFIDTRTFSGDELMVMEKNENRISREEYEEWKRNDKVSRKED